ncbi:unnamed protein product [Adineta ricciae]|uniref:NHL repeat containing protein n=1 Tax=Adineta ricciae TaxID=249248 RepID=A0A815HKM6_ADIRI|nr:unnamed protein product [Adineta ricciae]
MVKQIVLLVFTNPPKYHYRISHVFAILPHPLLLLTLFYFTEPLKKYLLRQRNLVGFQWDLSSALHIRSHLLLTLRSSCTSIGQLVLSPTANWSTYAITVAGSAACTAGSTSSLLYTNLGIFITDNDTLYVADQLNHRIVVIQPNSTVASNIIGSGPGTGPSQFYSPTDVFVTNDAIYVLDAVNYRVQKWWKNGSNVTTVVGITATAGTSASNTTIGLSYQIYVDSSGNIYVLDFANHRVMLFPPNSTSGTAGTMVAGNGVAGTGPNALYNPRGMFVDSTGAMYIADTYNHRVQYWIIGACYATTVAGIGTLGTSLSQLYYPVAVIVDMNEYMYITDQFNNRILRWLVGTCVGQCVASCDGTAAGSAANKFYYSVRVVFDSNGSLYDLIKHKYLVFQYQRPFQLVLQAAAAPQPLLLPVAAAAVPQPLPAAAALQPLLLPAAAAPQPLLLPVAAAAAVPQPLPPAAALQPLLLPAAAAAPQPLLLPVAAAAVPQPLPPAAAVVVPQSLLVAAPVSLPLPPASQLTLQRVAVLQVVALYIPVLLRAFLQSRLICQVPHRLRLLSIKLVIHL